jgi:hypothetical protein
MSHMGFLVSTGPIWSYTLATHFVHHVNVGDGGPGERVLWRSPSPTRLVKLHGGPRSTHELEDPAFSQVLLGHQCPMQRVDPVTPAACPAGAVERRALDFRRSGAFSCAGEGGTAVGFRRSGDVPAEPGPSTRGALR